MANPNIIDSTEGNPNASGISWLIPVELRPLFSADPELRKVVANFLVVLSNVTIMATRDPDLLVQVAKQVMELIERHMESASMDDCARDPSGKVWIN